MNKQPGRLIMNDAFLKGNNGGDNNGNSVSYTVWPPYPVTSYSFIGDKRLEPERIIYNDRTTVVYWSDNTKTKSTASPYETFDPEIGFAMCLLKKLYGKKIYGRKLYRRMISQAEVHSDETKESFENWKKETKNREGVKSKKVIKKLYSHREILPDLKDF